LTWSSVMLEPPFGGIMMPLFDSAWVTPTVICLTIAS